MKEIYFISIWLAFAVIVVIVYIIRKRNYKVDMDKFYAISQSKLLLAENCGGRIGFYNYTVGAMNVEVYENGLILKPMLGEMMLVLKNDITDIIDKKGMFARTHTIILYMDKNIKRRLTIYCRLEESVKLILLSK